MKRAFTLVERRATTAIFLILSALLLPNMQTYIITRSQVSRVGLKLNAPLSAYSPAGLHVYFNAMNS